MQVMLGVSLRARWDATLVSLKKHNACEVLLYRLTMQVQQTKDTFYVYGFILEPFMSCTASLIISLHRKNLSKLKTN